MPTLSGPEYLNGQFSVAADGTVSLTTPPLSTAGGTISPGPVIIRNTAAAPQPFTSPLLHVATEAGNANLVIDNYTAANLPVLWLRRARGTAAVPATVQSGDALGAILGQAYDSAGPGYYTPARIDFTALQNMSSASQGTAINFINSGTDASFLVRRMQIARGVVIGNPAPDPGQGGLVLNQNAASLPVSINSGGMIFTAFSGDGQAAYIATVSNTLPSFLTRGYAGTAAAPMASPDGSAFGQLQMQGFNGTTFAGGALINGIATEAWTGTANGARLNFMTVAPGTTVMAERMTILGNGNVGIGTTAPAARLHVINPTSAWTSTLIGNATTGQSYGLSIQAGTNESDYSLLVQNMASANSVIVYGNGLCYNTSGSWASLSDVSVKQDVKPYRRGLDAIVALNPVEFRYAKGTPFAEPDKPSRLLFGLIADEVKPHVPEIVGTTTATIGKKKGVELSTLEPGNLIFALINAVKELNDQGKEMRAKIAALESATVH